MLLLRVYSYIAFELSNIKDANTFPKCESSYLAKQKKASVRKVYLEINNNFRMQSFMQIIQWDNSKITIFCGYMYAMLKYEIIKEQFAIVFNINHVEYHNQLLYF